MTSNNYYFLNDKDNKSFDPNDSSLFDFNIITQLNKESENINNQLFYNLHNIEIPDNIIPIAKKKGISTNINISSLFFTFENIKDQLKDNSFIKYKIIIDKSIEAQEIKEIEYEMKSIKKQRKKNGKKVATNIHISPHLRGRKRAVDINERAHNKKSPDNIIKKIKKYFIEYLINFLNAIIREKEYRLKMLDYKKYINKLKREEDLKFLKMIVKDCLSQDISPKYIKSSSDHNKIRISKILNEQKENKVIKFVFNMTIKDWIELFTLKKTFMKLKI